MFVLFWIFWTIFTLTKNIITFTIDSWFFHNNLEKDVKIQMDAGSTNGNPWEQSLNTEYNAQPYLCVIFNL